MKQGIHPDYREVLFHDVSNDFKFITRSTIGTREKAEFEGKEYPLVKIEVSSESHPFYTGKHKIVDTAAALKNSAKSSVQSVPRLPSLQSNLCTMSKKAAQAAFFVFCPPRDGELSHLPQPASIRP